MSKVIFSGIQPSGQLHIGNYFGAISQWVEMQKEVEGEYLFCLVNLHSITVAQDPKTLKENTYALAAWYIAAGIDTEKSSIFIQSQNPDHASLTWMLDCVTPMGWMERMTQYKDKSKKQGERTSVGLFHYPSLMAADILLYDTDMVPVGDDQKQHVELARDVAQKFNSTFGETFKIPAPHIVGATSRIMSLQNPLQKMSKSESDPAGTINLTDSPDDIQKKIMRAVTDSGSDVRAGNDKPALTNLINIFAACTRATVDDVQSQYASKGYGDFKKDLAEALVTTLAPIQSRFTEVSNDSAALHEVLNHGLKKSRAKSSQKLQQARDAMGLV